LHDDGGTRVRRKDEHAVPQVDPHVPGVVGEHEIAAPEIASRDVASALEAYSACEECGSRMPSWAYAQTTRPELSNPALGVVPPHV
jgi:hypothetical protein